MPHTWAVATTVVPVSELIGRDFEFEEIVGLIAAHRLMVPTVTAKTYNRASLRLSVTIIGLRRVRLKAAPVSAAPMSMLRTQVRPIAPGARWAGRPPTAVLAYLACMGTNLGL
jgi:hypothetical protein